VPGRDIFISYSREDRPAARHFAKCFADEGFSVWWDATLQAGQTFDEVIERELRDAKAVVVRWSPRSVRSRWVRAEATLADRSNKLCPAIIEACDRPIIFELTHTADLADWSGDMSDPRWRTYVDDLSDLVGRSNEPASEPVVERRTAKPAARRQAPTDHPFRGFAEERRATRLQDDQPASPARSKRGAPRAAPFLPSSDDDDGDHTQFYVSPEPPKQAMPPEDIDDEFHCLEIADGQKRYVVSPVGLKIGRTPPADIVIPDPGVSRTHCTVELAGDKLRVTDLNSTNGTYIEGKRIAESALLEIGGVLRVGNVSLRHEVRTRASLAA
jgi:hypothetical protein